MREAGDGIEIGLPLELLLLFFDLYVVMKLFLNKPGQLKLDILRQLLGLVRRPLSHLGPELHVVIGQAELQEVVVVDVAVEIFVESQKHRIQIGFLNIVDVIFTEEAAEFGGAYSVILYIPWQQSSQLYSFECCIRLELLSFRQLLSLFFDNYLTIRNCFQKEIQFVFR